MYSSSDDSSSDDDEIVLLCVSHLQDQTRSRGIYMADVNKTRNQRGEFSILCPDLRLQSMERFYCLFRMSQQRFDDLVQRVRPFIAHKKNHRFPISAEQRLALTLWILAHGDAQKYIAIRDRIGQKTANVIFNETCRAIWTALSDDFIAQPTITDYEKIAKDFWEIWNFPNCLGAMDGKHIAIKAPPNCGSQYYNYKKFNSIVLLAICDANYFFTVVDVGDFGCNSDGGVLSNSAFGQQLKEGTLQIPGLKKLPGSDVSLPHVFVADEAFPLTHTIMRPYPGIRQGHMPEVQRIYNYRLSRARRTIENAFGILSARWRILRKTIECTPQNAEAIVLATVALHNFLKKTDAKEAAPARYVPPFFADYEDENGALCEGDWRKVAESGLKKARRTASNNYQAAARDTREAFMKFFLTLDGAVPWQEKVANRGLERAD